MLQNIFRSLFYDMKEAGVMAYLMKALTSALKEKKRSDERAKRLAHGVLSEWVDEQIALCMDSNGGITRVSIQKSEAMSTELYTSLSTALDMDNESIASQATTMLRLKASRSFLISELIRFDTYAMSMPRTIKLQYKH